MKVAGEQDTELYLIYKCSKSDMELYSYYKDGYITQGSGNNVILKTNKGCMEYALDVYFLRMLDNEAEGEVHYYEDDFDNDGSIELACAFTMDTGSDYHNERLFVFDYNNETEEYDLYYLRFEDMADDVAKAIVEYYGDGYEWSEVDDTSFLNPHASDTVRMCSGIILNEGNPTYIYGNYEYVNVKDGAPFIMKLIVSEVYHPQAAEMVCKVTYQGDGCFAVSKLGYEEYSWREDLVS